MLDKTQSKSGFMLDKIFNDLKEYKIDKKISYKEVVLLGYQVGRNKAGEPKTIQIQPDESHIYTVVSLVESGINSRKIPPFCFFTDGAKPGMGYVLPFPYSEYEDFALKINSDNILLDGNSVEEE